VITESATSISAQFNISPVNHHIVDGPKSNHPMYYHCLTVGFCILDGLLRSAILATAWLLVDRYLYHCQ